MPLFGPFNLKRLLLRPKVSKLIKVLKGSDIEKKKTAVEALGKIGDPRALEPLVSLLSHQNNDVQIVASKAIREIGKTATDKLIAIITNEQKLPLTRYNAASALGKIGDPRAVEPLIGILTDEQSSPADLRLKAAYVLGKIGDPRAVEPIRACAENKSIGLFTAVEALGAIGWQPDRGELGALHWALKGELNKCVAIGEPAVEPLILMLQDPVRKTTSVIEALGKIGDPRAVEPLIGILTDEQESKPLFRSTAASALEQLGESPVEPLIGILTDEQSSPAARWDAAYLLGKIGDPRAVESLCKAFADKSWEYQDKEEAIIKALEQIGESAVEPLIGELTNKNKSQMHRTIAARALVRIGGSRAVAPLVGILEAYLYESRILRDYAIKALDKLGWQPTGEAGVVYWAVKRKYDKCIDIGKPALRPLLDILTNRLRDPLLVGAGPDWEIFTKIGGPEAKEALHSYLRYLKKKYEETIKEGDKYSQLPKERTMYEHYRDLIEYLGSEIGQVGTALRSFPD